MPSTKIVFFGPIGKTRWPPWPQICWDIFDFSSETAERNSTKLDRKQDHNIFYQVCVFGTIGCPGLWLAETFSTSLKPLNGIQRNLTESKISTSSTEFVFFGPIGKIRWPPWHLIGWDIFATSLKTLNGIQRYLTGSKISTPSTKFVFFGPIGKARRLPWPILQKGCTLYSGARYVALWGSFLFFLAFFARRYTSEAALPMSRSLKTIYSRFS